MRKALQASIALISALATTVVVAPPAAAAPMCFGKRATIVGSNEHQGIERIVGTPGNDVIVGRNGSDVIFGRGGNDRICGGDFIDKIKGGRGRDRISSGSVGCSEERYFEVIEGNRGRDRMVGGDCLEKIYGGKGADVITDPSSTLDQDELHGGAGDDEMSFGGGDEGEYGVIFIPGPGDDVMRSAPNSGARVDYSKAARGVRVDLDAGRAGGEGRDTLKNFYAVTGSAHADVLRGTPAHNHLEGLGGSDNIDGRDGDDSIYGHQGDDVLFGGLGNDWLDPGFGDDHVAGGEGIDELTYGGIRVSLHIDLSTGRATGAGLDTIEDIENVSGGRKDDVLIGDDGPNELTDCCRAKSADEIHGGGGDDYIYADWGPDVVRGGAGDDTILGGHGSDDLDGGEGVDEVDGGDGDDTCMGEVMTNCEGV